MKKTTKIKLVLVIFIVVLLAGILGIVLFGNFRKGQSNAENTSQEKQAEEVEEIETAEIAADVNAAEEPEEMVPEEAESAEAESAEEEPEAPQVLSPEEPELVENSYKIAIDPGHQGKGNSEKEPIGPGASQTKAKVASGTTGWTTGVPEYVLNLDVSLKLKEELEARGYEVYMTRETHEVNISNAERAQMAAEAGADILVRIHANGSTNTSVNGALTMAPSMSNPFLNSELVSECQRLSQEIIGAFCETTGANNQGVYQTDDMSGLNWCTIPATIVELGYMTNAEEDTKMQTEEYQNLMVQGIANGIDQYFAIERTQTTE